MGWLRSLTFKIILNHILVATTSSVLVALVVAFLLIFYRPKAEEFEPVTQVVVAMWQWGLPDGSEAFPGLSGFTIIVSPENRVLFTKGTTACRTDQLLSSCAPELTQLAPGSRFIDYNGAQGVEVVKVLLGGEKVLARYGKPAVEPFFIIGDFVINGVGQIILFFATVSAICSLPVALLLGWFSASRITRRMKKVAQASQKFADGDLQIRVKDKRKDEVGELARQFDNMAEALEQNVVTLRELAQRNTELTQQAEHSAVQAERLRLSRDLHDDIAQNLFSLSATASGLPSAIERGEPDSPKQAKVVAELAERTLLELREILVELRPSRVIEQGLAQAIQSLAQEWQIREHIPVNTTVILSGKRYPAGLEDVIYRVVKEGLSNIAKHASAHSVVLTLIEGQTQLTLSLTDDGKGFPANQSSPNGKFGLISMRERAQAVGGNLIIESDTLRGTTLRLVLPLQKLEIVG
jgi:signal transduction histidine kinase